MNKEALKIIALISFIVLLIDAILFFALGIISGTVFGITALISAPLAIIPFLLIYAPEEMAEIWNDSKFAGSNWLPRTKESTLFEVTSAFILIISWVIFLATHSEELEMLLVITVIVIALLITAYNTEWNRYYNRWRWLNTKQDNMKLCLIRSRLNRILAVELALFGMLSLIPGVGKAFVVVAFIVMAITYIGAFFINK